MRDLGKNMFVRRFLTIGRYEEDPQFREVLRSLTRKSLMVYSGLGLVIILIYVLSHLFLQQKAVSWTFSTYGHSEVLWMPDKVFIMLGCLLLILLSRSSQSLGRIRLIMLLLIWIACIGMVTEDIINRMTSFSTAYVTLPLILGVMAVPYKGWQTALFNGVVIVSILFVINVLTGWLGMTVPPLNRAQVIFICSFSVLLTGVSSQLYLNRYVQYRARRRAEQLNNRLEERAHVLEMLREESEQQARQILRNEQLKDRFFANISHEFRTPLTLMLGPLRDLLSDGTEEASAQDHKKISVGTLRMMLRNGRQLLNLINQLLDLSRIDSGRQELDLEPLDLGALAREMVRSFAGMAEQRGVALTCIVGGGPYGVLADKALMQRILANLLSNALKFTPEGGTVAVTVNRTGSAEQGVELRVRDSGIGIEADDLPHVFDRFYRAGGEGRTADIGTGIGLALVREIVEQHGGTVHVHSKPGEGSEFIVNLYDIAEIDRSDAPPQVNGAFEPLPDPVAEGDGEWDELPGPSESDAPLVVLIDDNPDILAWLTPRLAQRYRVLGFEDSRKALESVRQEPPDLVISDVMMPQPDGFEICRQLKEDPKLNHLPVILLTARAGEEHRIEGLESGADDYISKPFSADELLVRAENLIELRRTLRSRYSGQVRLEGREVEVSSADGRFLERVQSVIEEYMENGNFGVEWLAGEVNLSPRHLQRKIRELTDLSAGGFIRMNRLERAAQLLRQEWGNVSEVAYKVGFSDTKYFSRLFRQTFGVNPSEYDGQDSS